MEISSNHTNRLGQRIDAVYSDIDGEIDLNAMNIQGVHAYCFCADKLVVVYSDRKGSWSPPGGGVEEGEDVRSAMQREVAEEANMNVLKQCLIGYQVLSEPKGTVSQARFVCIVEPYGPFVSDPGGDVTKIELIDPMDYKKYFDWGEIGDHVMLRALELKRRMDWDENYAQ